MMKMMLKMMKKICEEKKIENDEEKEGRR